MKRAIAWTGLVLVIAGLFWYVPLFHVVATGQASRDRSEDFDTVQFARAFWSDQLVPNFEQAVDTTDLLTAIADSPAAARRRFGRSPALGRAVIFLVRGRGHVVSIDERGVGVSLDAAAHEPAVWLKTGLVFGNTVRDASGLLRAGDFRNSQQFNDISTQLNRIVESSVLPRLQAEAHVGRPIEFVGCARVVDLPADAHPLKLTPLDVRFD